MKNVVFDLGGVLVYWNPQMIVEKFTKDALIQSLLINEIFRHEDWVNMDRGILSETEFIERGSERTSLSSMDLSRLLELKRMSLDVIPHTLSLLERISKRGYSVYCLSNMAKETYQFLRKRHSFWHLFRGIVISGHEGVVKPEPEIFEILLNRYALHPEETLFIDDSRENTLAASRMGIHTVTFTADSSASHEVDSLLNENW